MNKSTKGAAAAATAAVLLLGGGGSLAYWTATQTVLGSSVTAGELKLGAGNCSAWMNGATTVTKFVPGDTLTKTCTYPVTATGENLKGKLVVPSSINLTPGTTGTSLKATVTTAYKLDGTTIANDGVFTSTSANTKTLEAKVSVAIPFGDTTNGAAGTNANDMQAITGSLADLAITLQQTAS